MKQRKIRGHKRLQKQITNWTNDALAINLDFLSNNNYWYEKIIVHPWCDLSRTNSEIPEPKSVTRKLILSALEEIYDNWKLQLDKLGEPYYLKIWLYQPRVSKSQVVCAIGEKIAYYTTCFNSIDVPRKKSDLTNQLSPTFEWESFEDSQIWSEQDLAAPKELYSNIEDYHDSIRLLSKIKKANYRTLAIDTPDGNDILHFQPKGLIWIGEKSNGIES
ncbi:MAG: hypothetical protein EOO90_03735 [Pedobacter sp.]|nr:MAG: hypothetical protein EOO90_03735 [Pedobacter sp.]